MKTTDPSPPLIEPWRKEWRYALAPLMPTAGLRKLLTALEDDDPALLQGSTCSPPPLKCVEDWPPEAACPVAYAFWKGAGLQSVAELEEAFARACFEADQKTGEASGVRHFLNWADDTPRDQMRRLLAEEVRHNLSTRAEVLTTD